MPLMHPSPLPHVSLSPIIPPSSSLAPRRRRLPPAIRIDTPPLSLDSSTRVRSTSSASSSSSLSNSIASSATSSLDLPPFTTEPTPQPVLHPSAPHLPRDDRPPPAPTDRRRASVISLPIPSANFLHRKEEDGSPAVPYGNGPIQILPGIWLGSEDNARNWQGLVERGIKSILNVAKEVPSPFEVAVTPQKLRPVVSTPNLAEHAQELKATFHPAHPSGRPALHYLRLPWSHGQSDLSSVGFADGMRFIDEALRRGDGVLVHCQMGVSRSATMVIALVMRAAVLELPSVPPEVWALKQGGMQAAYSFVKEKSKFIGPNMSLIYQLMDYDRTLKGKNKTGNYPTSESSSAASAEEDWMRKRALLDDDQLSSDSPLRDDLNHEVMREAKALDEAMVERRSSLVSNYSGFSSNKPITDTSNGSFFPASRYSKRSRAGSSTSNSNSVVSEDLIEVDEEHEVFGYAGGFDRDSISFVSQSTHSPDSATEPPAEDDHVKNADEVTDSSPQVQTPVFTPLTARPRPAKFGTPTTAPAWKTSFGTEAYPSAPSFQATFSNAPPPLNLAQKRRIRPPPVIAVLPPVPSSPFGSTHTTAIPSSDAPPPDHPNAPPTSSRPPLHLGGRKVPLRRPAPLSLAVNALPSDANRTPWKARPSSSRSSSISSASSVPFPSKLTLSVVSTPSQTLFVFPPDSARDLQSPSTMTLHSQASPAPWSATPRVSTFRGRYVGMLRPATPTTACSHVDARGYVAGRVGGKESSSSSTKSGHSQGAFT